MAKKRALIFVGAVAALIAVPMIVSSISDSIQMSQIRAEIDRKNQIEKQTSTEVGKIIAPELNRYANIIEAGVQTSVADRKKEVDALRKLAAVAKNQGAKVEALDLYGSSAKYWNLISELLTTDAQVMESIFAKMKPEERTRSAELHRKAATILQKHVDEAFMYTMDLYDSGSSSLASAPVSSGSHFDFIKETSDLPSSAQLALDKIYKVDPARARELSRLAHDAGVQNLPNQ